MTPKIYKNNFIKFLSENATTCVSTTVLGPMSAVRLCFRRPNLVNRVRKSAIVKRNFYGTVTKELSLSLAIWPKVHP
jgi:hypothetical protein